MNTVRSEDRTVIAFDQLGAGQAIIGVGARRTTGADCVLLAESVVSVFTAADVKP